MGPRFANGSGRNSSGNNVCWNKSENNGTITDHTIATDGHTLKNLDIGANTGDNARPAFWASRSLHG